MGHKELDTTEIRALSLFGAGGGTYRQNAEIHMNCQRSPSTLHPGLDTGEPGNRAYQRTNLVKVISNMPQITQQRYV